MASVYSASVRLLLRSDVGRRDLENAVFFLATGHHVRFAGIWKALAKPGPYDNERLGFNTIRWLDASNAMRLCTRTNWLYGAYERHWIDQCVKRGYRARILGSTQPLTPQALAGCGVLIYKQWDHVPESEFHLIETFVRNGGGLVFSGPGWSWLAYYKNLTLDDFPQNKLGLHFGVRFEDGEVADPTNNSGNPGCPIIHRFYPATPFPIDLTAEKGNKG